MTQCAKGGGGFLHLHLHAELCLVEYLAAMTGSSTDNTHRKTVIADEGKECLGEFSSEVA